MLTLDKIYHAAYVLRDVVRKTDLILAPHLNPDCELYLKTENLQTTGSFKVRGAYYKISQLSDEELKRAGVGSDLVRLSVGIEDIDDIIEDIDRALAKA